jgi:alpha-amylase/alpha-mannosidase (GH57 family)
MLRVITKISFNIGPTLFSWLAEKHPDTYQTIIEADRLSVTQHAGHGNAIAQVYNHMIMSLAHRRDQTTQVKWGIYEFKHRFGREPEGLWLPETACNEETMEVLIEEGIKFTILAPHQADAIRPIKKENWHQVSSGTLNTQVPYRYFHGKSAGRFLDIFFYDGHIAKEVAFGNLAFEAKHFGDSLVHAKSKHSHDAQLIHVATDGETFGHHKGYGERALAYLVETEAPNRGFRIVNYGEFLGKHPPQFAVRIKKGEDGHGTSWSCAHGVKRWKEHCGCQVNAPHGWTQKWRKPLREALNWLRDELNYIFDAQGNQYFKDPWKARDEYIAVILDRSEPNVANFLNRFAKQPLGKAESAKALQLLEMACDAMLMFTSCGWFFNDISGIETTQILRYAARAIQLAEEITKRSLESEFLHKLQKAKSNVHELKDGRVVYERFVKPSMVHKS